MKSNAKLRQHYLLHCCVTGVIENIKASEKKSQDVIKRLKKRSQTIRDFTLYSGHEPDQKEWQRINKRIKILQKIFEENLSYDVLVFQKALMIAVHEVSKAVPNTPKYKQLYTNYQYFNQGMYTFFTHLDEAREDQSKNFDEWRQNKADMISRKILELIRGDL